MRVLAFLVIGGCLLGLASALTVSPGQVTVPIVLQDPVTLEFELSTDLPDGATWQVSSTYSFVTFAESSGTAPAPIRVSVDQVGLGEFLSSGSRPESATVVVRAGAEQFPVRLVMEDNPYLPAIFFRTNDPHSLVFQEGFDQDPRHLVKVQVPSGLIEGVYQCPDRFSKVIEDASGTKLFVGRLSARDDNPEPVAVLDVASFEEEDPILIPPTAQLRAGGPGFLVLVGGEDTYFEGRKIRDDLFTFDLERHEIVEAFGEIPEGDKIPVLSRRADGNTEGEVLLLRWVESLGLMQIYRVHRDALILEASNYSYNTGSLRVREEGLTQLSQDGERIFHEGSLVDRRTADHVRRLLVGPRAIDRRGKLGLNVDSLSYIDSGLEIQDPVIGDFGTGSPGTFTSDDRYLVRVGSGAERTLRFISSDEIPGFPVPTPSPGEVVDSRFPVISVPEVFGATSYVLRIGSPILGLIAEMSSPTPEFQLDVALDRGYRYRWNVSAETPSGLVTGQTYEFEVGLLFSEISSGGDFVTTNGAQGYTQASRVIGRNFVFSTAVPREEGHAIVTGRTGVEVTAGQDPNRGHRGVVAGDKVFVNSDEGVLIYQKFDGGRFQPGGLVPRRRGDPGTEAGGLLAASGEMLFVGSAASRLDGAYIDVYRTNPEVVYESSIQIPRRLDDSESVLDVVRMAVSGDLVVLSILERAPAGTVDPPFRLLIYQRNPGTGLYDLKEDFTRTRASDGEGIKVATDGLTVVAAGKEPGSNRSQLTFYKRQPDDSWLEQDTLVLEGNPMDDRDSMAFHGETVVTLVGEGVRVFRRSRINGWLLQSAIDQRGTGFRFHEVAAARGVLLARVGGGDRNLVSGILPLLDVFSADGVPIIKASPLATVALQGAPYEARFTLEDPDDTLELEAGPSWLQLSNPSPGVFLLKGNAPAQPQESVIRLRATSSEGYREFSIFDLSVVGDDLAPVVELVTKDAITAVEGSTVELEVGHESLIPHTLQWLRDGEAITEGDRASLFLYGVTPEDTGRYQVRYTSVFGSILTDEVLVTVEPATLSGKLPGADNLDPGNSRFKPATIGDAEPVLKWTQNGNHFGAAINQGAVFVSTEGSDRNSRVQAYDLESGLAKWSYETPSRSFLSPPAAHSSGVFFSRRNVASPAGEYLALSPDDGRILWEADFQGLSERNPEFFGPPVLSDTRVWIRYNSNLFHSREFDGSSPARLEGQAPLTLVFSGDRGFSVDHEFREENGGKVGLLAVAADQARFLKTVGDRGVMADGPELVVFELSSRRILYRLTSPEYEFGPGEYRSFAISGKYLLAVSQASNRFILPEYAHQIELYDLESGELLRTTTPPPATTLGNQIPDFPLILLNDAFIAGSTSETTIYDLESLEPLHVLPEFGGLSYGEGNLLINRVPFSQFDEEEPAITVYRLNDRPTLEDAVVMEVIEDQPFEFEVSATNGEPGEDLVFELVTDLEWLEISAAGRVSGLVTQEIIGTGDRVQEYTVRVSDGVTAPVERDYSLTLIEVNDPPVVTLSDPVLQEDADPLVIHLDTVSSDEESAVATLAYEIANDESGAIADVSVDGSVLTITLRPDQFGVFTFAVQATDPGGATGSQTVRVVVEAVNDAPVYLGDGPFQLVAQADGGNQTISLASLVEDVDPGDVLSFSIHQNSEPSLFTSLTIDPQSKDLLIDYAPYVSGSSDLEIVATDLEGEMASIPVKVILPKPDDPMVMAAGDPGVDDEITLNHQTGLYEQKVTITNSAARAIGGFSLEVTGLSDGYRLYQQSDTTVIFGEPVGVGESVELLLEYFSSESGNVPTPTLTVTPILPQPQDSAETIGVVVDRIAPTGDGGILLEFATEMNARYVIQYSFDMATWFNSPATVVGKPGSTQWLDQGFPRTSCHPSVCATRFYRVLRVVDAK